MLTRFAEAWEPSGPAQDLNSIGVMNQVLKSEFPDLVVLNGDLITGDDGYKENCTHYLDQIVQPLLDHDFTWAATYGNHDSAFNLSRDELLKREQRWPNSRTQKMVDGDNAGVTNYYLPVYASNDTKGEGTPTMLLWFFDSRGGNSFQKHGESVPTWVDESVAEWFTNANENLVEQYKAVIPSLVFVHIPTRVSREAQTKSGISPIHHPGINDDMPLFYQAEHYCEDGSQHHECRGGQDSPFIEAVANTSGVVGMLSAHDHGSSWCWTWDKELPGLPSGNGMKLCFGQHTGYGGYGNWVRGSRQVVITDTKLKEKEFETWIRLESGEITGAVSLNSTYGQDEYPQTKDVKGECIICNTTHQKQLYNSAPSNQGRIVLLLFSVSLFIFLMQFMI